MTDAVGSLSFAAAPRRLVVLRAPEIVGWAVIAATAFLTAMIMAVRGLGFDWQSGARPLFACGVLLAGAAVYRTWRPDERIAASLAAVAQLIVFAAVAETFSYAVASLDRPLCDDALMAWDKALGLDWRAYLDAVNARPWLATALGLAYESLVVQIIAAAAVLGLTGRYAACRTFVLAFLLTGLATVAISGLLPAVSEFVHRGLHPVAFANVDASAAYAPLGPFERLRAGTLRTISLADGEGIIAFPSFHAALGVLFIAALWPLRWLRGPGLVLNLLLLASTPVNGGHYFVDAIAGVLIAVAALAVARRLDGWCGGAGSDARGSHDAQEVSAAI